MKAQCTTSANKDATKTIKMVPTVTNKARDTNFSNIEAGSIKYENRFSLVRIFLIISDAKINKENDAIQAKEAECCSTYRDTSLYSSVHDSLYKDISIRYTARKAMNIPKNQNRLVFQFSIKSRFITKPRREKLKVLFVLI